jgi:predicted helicase
LDGGEGAICRAKGVHPRFRKVLVAVECKFHAGTLQLAQARSFLGLTEEISKGHRFLVTNTSSKNAAKMVNHHKVEVDFGIDLRNAKVAEALQARFERTFRNFRVAKGR